MRDCTRRDILKCATASLLCGPSFHAALADDRQPVKPKSVAAVVTIYTRGSHSDVILGKILEGWKQDGGSGPALRLASMYVDQFPEGDLARQMGKKYGVPIFDSIERALTAGGDRIPIDGVISIGEHGDYPYNSKGQHLYPRRRFFEEIAATLKKYGRIVPVFSDKHLGPVWSDAKWMYDRACELNIPFMAGSSLPVGYRQQEITVPMNCEIESAVGIGYSGLDIYGIHALEFYQCHVERRQNAERGVKSVRCLEGADLCKAVDGGAVAKDVLDAALAVVPKSGTPDIRQDENAALFLFDYEDGLQGAVLMLSCVAGTAVALKHKGKTEPIATAFDERTEPRYPHFAYLLKAIERMIHTGQPSSPGRTHATDKRDPGSRIVLAGARGNLPEDTGIGDFVSARRLSARTPAGFAFSAGVRLKLKCSNAATRRWTNHEFFLPSQCCKTMTCYLRS